MIEVQQLEKRRGRLLGFVLIPELEVYFSFRLNPWLCYPPGYNKEIVRTEQKHMS